MFRVQQTLFARNALLRAGAHQRLALSNTALEKRQFAAPPTHQGMKEQPSMEDLLMGDLDSQARKINEEIEVAKQRIQKNSEKGMSLAQSISKDVQEDQFMKMQRFEIFIAKMEELANFEKYRKKRLRKVVQEMQAAFVTSRQPFKDILFHLNKALQKGFDLEVFEHGFKALRQAIRGKGTFDRPWEDYHLRELDISWRMQTLAGQFKDALSDRVRFNHYHFANSLEHFGEFGFKDIEIIKKSFDKLNQLLDEREEGKLIPLRAPTYQEEVYGGYKNILPKNYVYEGYFENKEFKQHLTTLLEWKEDPKPTLPVKNQDLEVFELESSMKQLLDTASKLKQVQVEMQASIDSLRQQFFKLQESKDKNRFMQENKYIRLEMLELEELLVKGGYIDPDEAFLADSAQDFVTRMDRASKIFYEYASQYKPEIMSPQYNPVIEEAEKRKELEKQKNPNSKINLEEPHSFIQVGSLGHSLHGLRKMALSCRRENEDRDFLNEFYKNHTTKQDFKLDSQREGGNNFLENPFVGMKPDYLQAWKIFETEVDTIKPRLFRLINDSKEDTEGQLQGFFALSMASVEMPELRKQMTDRILQSIKAKKKPKLRNQAIIDGLYGMALQHKLYEGQDEIAEFLIKHLNKSLPTNWQHKLDLDSKLQLLWSASALGLESCSDLAKNLYIDLNSLNWDRINNDISFEQYKLLSEAMVYMINVSSVKNSDWLLANTNEQLRNVARNPSVHTFLYPEGRIVYDPFKKRVLEGIGRGLTMASVDHQSTLEENLMGQTNLEQEFQSTQFPFTPDIHFGYKGQKVMLSVVSSQDTLSDIGKANGRFTFQSKILEKLSDEPVQSVAVPISSVLDYDIQNFKLQVRENFNFLQELNQQLKINQKEWRYQFQLEALASFGANFTRQLGDLVSGPFPREDKKRFHSFFKQLYRVFQQKHHTEKQYEKVAFQQSLDQTKFEMMKLHLFYQSLPLHQAKLIDGLCGEFSSFSDLIDSQRQKMKLRVTKETYEPVEVDSNVDLSWMGTRQEVELPLWKGEKVRKDIEPELINQRFMWVDDYFHYKDWQERMQEAYDNFNLLTVPRREGDFKYFYNKGSNRRIVPQGIFPPPNQKRQLLQGFVNPYVAQLNHLQSPNELNELEREPLKLMVTKELQRSSKLSPVTPELSYITNLQNLKQGLKQDYKDREILELLCQHTSFTDRLILEHLNLYNSENSDKKEAQFVKRDARAFREFLKESYLSKDQEDPFTHFYLKESGKVERVHRVLQQFEDQKEELHQRFGEDKQFKQAEERVLRTLKEKMESMLLQNYEENEDNLSLSHQFETEVKVNYHLPSLMKSEFLNDIDPELDDSEITDSVFLERQRARAEAKLIKSTILFKVFNNVDLSEREQIYVRNWVRDIKTNKKTNLLNVRDSMVPKTCSRTTLDEALSAEDFYALNQVPQVELSRDTHGKFALNDLVLELSHFLDEDSINRVETELLSNKIRKDWELPDDFKVIETRNKEIGLVMNELEELAWRMAGQFDEREVQSLVEMFSINRNQDFFDQHFYEQDVQSMKDFIQDSACFDDKHKMLEQWVVRKEEEIKSRISLPTKKFQKSDKELFEQVDAKLKSARERLVLKVLRNEFYSPEEVQDRRYQDLSTKELSTISEALCIRLGLFNGKFPSFMPHLVRAVMEHPNLPQTEFSKLDSFCKIFELDWRGDTEIENQLSFMATNPVYLHPRDRSNFVAYSEDNQTATQMLQKACAPYVEKLARQLVWTSKKEMQRDKQGGTEEEQFSGSDQKV